MNTAELTETLAGLGAVKQETHWRIPVPSGHLRIDVELDRRRPLAHVAIDRWGGRNAPEEAGDWLEANITPFVHRALAHSPRKELTMPGPGATYAGADVLKDDLEDVLRLWIPREVAWQENTAP